MSQAGARDAEPLHCFDLSRRLTGANRWYDGTAVVLTARPPWADNATLRARWAMRVQALAAALGWPAPDPRAVPHPTGTTLAFAAPAQALFTATEVNEWAWEQVVVAAGGPLQALGFEPAQPAFEGDAAAAAFFGRRAAAELSRPLARLEAAASARGLPCLADDDTVSIGAGERSRSWPRAALPLPLDVPWASLGDVPTVLVTGSNGKTTTTRLLAAFAREAGLVSGMSSTEGVFVGGAPLEQGDWAGPAGARAVLREPRVQIALLETARGGILRRGLAVARADVALVTNVSADHLGEHGIATVEDIAEVKLTLARAVRQGGTLVLNAADPVLMAVAGRMAHVRAVNQALFAPDHEHPALQAHRAAGGSTCGAAGQGAAARLVCHHAGQAHELGRIADMPLTVGGAAAYNTENIAAAVLAAACLPRAAGAGPALPWAALATTLARFGAGPADNPGRLERWQHRGASVLIDYAHNPDGLARLLAVARSLLAAGPQPGRLLLLLGQAGNRDDAALAELAAVAAAARPALVLIKELPAMLRGRAPGEVPARLEAGLLAAGHPAGALAHRPDEQAAASALLASAAPGDVVVLPIHTAAVRAELQAQLREG